jgi:hypothetical protein
MSALFAECDRCHHPRFDHPTQGPCRGCLDDLALARTFQEIPATADTPDPPICEEFVIPVADPETSDDWEEVEDPDESAPEA